MQFVVSPSSLRLNAQAQPGQALSELVALRVGQVLEATVLDILANGHVRLAIAGGTLDVPSRMPLAPGTTLRLAVEPAVDGVKLVPTPVQPEQGAGNRTGLVAALAGQPAAPPAAAATAAAGQPPAQQPAAQPAAAHVATGLEHKAAERGQPAGPPSGPPAQAAAAAAAGATASALASGNPAAIASPPAVAAPAPAVAPTPTQALAQALSKAVTQQNGAAPLFADLAALVQRTNLPAPVRAAARQLLALRLPLDAKLSGADIETAFQRSGTLLEAHLAARPDARAAATPPDLKAALAVFRQVVSTWIEALPAPKTPALPLPSAPVSAPLAGQPGGPVTAAPAEPARPPLPPPYAGAPTVAQPPLAPSLVPEAMPYEAARHLLAETDAAIGRQTLLQAASLPDQPGASPNATPRWSFDIPFATPQGTALAQFEISRDPDEARADGGHDRLWRVKFSLDVEPMGLVHAHVTYRTSMASPGTGQAGVTLWAERPEAAARLRAGRPALAEALRRADLEPGDLLVRGGEPPGPVHAPPAGAFLDRAT